MIVMETGSKELYVEDDRAFMMIVGGDNRWCSTYEVELEEIDKERISDVREEPSEQILLLKSGEGMYYLCIQKGVPIKTEALHLCPMCCHCSALSGSFGCQKVRDLGRNKKIEKYGFVLSGYEILNGRDDQTFIVSRCKNFEADSRESRRMEIEEIIRFLTINQRTRLAATWEEIHRYYPTDARTRRIDGSE
ncbi:MAG: hypothetical protein Q4F60_00820 [Candidatus Saccharibacteria bacterium]|nr:hypothetical protein [Candidatus Saccharibacteria bacterium]